MGSSNPNPRNFKAPYGSKLDSQKQEILWEKKTTAVSAPSTILYSPSSPWVVACIK